MLPLKRILIQVLRQLSQTTVDMFQCIPQKTSKFLYSREHVSFHVSFHELLHLILKQCEFFYDTISAKKINPFFLPRDFFALQVC